MTAKEDLTFPLLFFGLEFPHLKKGEIVDDYAEKVAEYLLKYRHTIEDLFKIQGEGGDL